MKKAIKKSLSVFLSLCILLSITAGIDLTAFAKTSGDYEYKILSDGTAQITKYNGSAANLAIQAYINGYKVTSIGERAFYCCDSLTSVTIPDGVKSISAGAFFDCDSLTKISVNESNQYYSSQSGVLFNKDKTELVQYPIGNTRTGYAIPDGVTILGKYAFLASNLTSVTIPETVTNIEFCAFDACAITSISIPSSVEAIGDGAFAYCLELKNITVDAGNKYYSSQNGVLFNKNKTELIQYPSAKRTSYSIPNSVTNIDVAAFAVCEITSINIPDSVVTIGDGAFQLCIYLKNITVDENNKYYSSLDGVLFNKDYTELIEYRLGSSDKSYRIPDGVTTIGACAFYGCWNLNNLTIPNSVKTIKQAAFGLDADTHSIATGTINYIGTKKQWNIIDIQDYNDCLKYAKINYSVHTYRTTAATTAKNGYVKCTDCGNVKSTIYYPKTIKLSKTSYTYDGKAKKPSVTVKDSKGNTINSKYYTVEYAKGRKNVGKYTVTVKFKGKYSGTVKKTFKINPKGTSVSKLTAGKKAFTVKWNKQKTQTTGYQIQYSISSKFKNAKTVTVSKNSTTSKTVKKLSAKKKYYVRVRTYKTVGKTKYYSSWSKAKSVKTK